jgi:hypothetical protein
MPEQVPGIKQSGSGDGLAGDSRKQPPRSSGGGFDPFAETQAADHFIGGMPVVLPEVRPPEGFGKISISFGGRTPGAVIDEPLPKPPEPQIQPEQESLSQPTSPDPDRNSSRIPLLRKFPSVPMAKSLTAQSRQVVPQEDAADDPESWQNFDPATIQQIGSFEGTSVPSEDVRDVFSDELGSFDPTNPGAADAPEFLNQYVTEIDDFAADKFWDSSDDELSDVPLPEREIDMTPHIPSITESIPTGGGLVDEWPVVPDSAEVRTQVGPDAAQADLPAAESRVEKTSAAPRAVLPPPQPAQQQRLFRPRRWRHAALLACAMFVAMALATTAVWVFVPTHTIVEGRLTLSHLPAFDSPQLKTIEADQRQRLSDDSTRTLALQRFEQERPGSDAGFLTSSAAYARFLQSLRYDRSSVANSENLVLTASGTDSAGDLDRLVNVVEAIYEKDADLNSVAAVGASALDAGEPSLASAQSQLDQQNAKIAVQKNAIAAAKNVGNTIPTLWQAASAAQADYQSSLDKLQSDLTRLAVLDSLLQPGSQPLAKTKDDPQLTALNSQIDDLAQRVGDLKGAGIGESNTEARKILNLAQKAFSDKLAPAEKTLASHPGLLFELQSAGDLQSRIADMIQDLVQRDNQSRQQLKQLKQFILDSMARRQQLLSDSDLQIQQLQSQEDTAEDQLAKLSAGSTTGEDQLRDQRIKVSDLKQKIHVRQELLAGDDNADLRRRLNKLIDGSTAQLRDQRTLIDDTIQTLQARLMAAPVSPDLTDAQTKAFDLVLVGAQNLGDVQTAFEQTVTEPDPAADSLVTFEHQLEVLQAQAKARQDFLRDAVPVTLSDQKRDELTQERQQVAGDSRDATAAMEQARRAFLDRVSTAVDTGLAIEAARQARQILPVLEAARDADAGDLAAKKSVHDDLAQKVNTTPQIERARDPQIVASDAERKSVYALFAMLAIGVASVFPITLALRRTAASPAL